MSSCTYLTREAKVILTNYRPVLTELSGLADLTQGTAALAFSLIWKCVDSNTNPRTLPFGSILSSQAVQISAFAIAEGLIKLSVPICMTTGYLAYKSFS